MDKISLIRSRKSSSHTEGEQSDNVQDLPAPKKPKLNTGTIMEYALPQQKHSDSNVLTQPEIIKQLGKWGGAWASSSEISKISPSQDQYQQNIESQRFKETKELLVKKLLDYHTKNHIRLPDDFVKLTKKEVYHREIRKYEEDTIKQFEKFNEIIGDVKVLEQDIDKLFQSTIPNAIKDVKTEEIKEFLENYLNTIKKRLSDARKKCDDNDDTKEVNDHIEDVKNEIMHMSIEKNISEYIDLNKSLEKDKARHFQKQTESYIQYEKEQIKIIESLVEMNEILSIEETVKNKDEDIQDIHKIIKELIEDLESEEEKKAMKEKFDSVQECLAAGRKHLEEQIQTLEAKETPVSNMQLFLDCKKAYMKYHNLQIEGEINSTTIEEELDMIKDVESSSEHQAYSEDRSSVGSEYSDKDFRSDDQVLLGKRRSDKATLEAEAEKAKLNLEKIKNTESEAAEQLRMKLSELIQATNTFFTRDRALNAKLNAIDAKFDKEIEKHDKTHYDSDDKEVEAFEKIEARMTKERIDLLQPYANALSELITQFREIDQNVSQLGGTQEESTSTRKVHFE